MAATKTKTEKLVSTLQNGRKMTASQIMEKFDFGCINSVYGTIARLRSNGLNITATPGKKGVSQYGLS
jgi:hypothetical protein